MIPLSHTNVFNWSHQSLWPSPQPTACTSPRWSLLTATGSNQVEARSKPTLPKKSEVDGGIISYQHIICFTGCHNRHSQDTLRKGITFKHKLSCSNYFGFRWPGVGHHVWSALLLSPTMAPPLYFVYICISAIPFSIYFAIGVGYSQKSL